MIGRVISGRYEIQAVVGTGGMAVVYRAWDRKNSQMVAVKVLRPEFEQDQEFVRRFSREAEAAAKMSHENIVNLLDVGKDNDMRYIVMEYVPGKTLKDLIRERGRIAPETAVRMAITHTRGGGPRPQKRHRPPRYQAAEHTRRRKGQGQGRRLRHRAAQDRADHPRGRQAELRAGQRSLLLPEQASGEVADEKSDLYSVGVVIYEMLTGEVPFDGDTAVSVALKHVSEEPRSMRSIAPLHLAGAGRGDPARAGQGDL